MAVFHLISTSIMMNEWAEQTAADQELESDLQAAMEMGHEGYHALHENSPAALRQQQHNDDNDDGSDSSPSARDNTTDRNEEDHLQKSASLRMRLKLKGKGDTTGLTATLFLPHISFHSFVRSFVRSSFSQGLLYNL